MLLEKSDRNHYKNWCVWTCICVIDFGARGGRGARARAWALGFAGGGRSTLSFPFCSQPLFRTPIKQGLWEKSETVAEFPEPAQPAASRPGLERVIVFIVKTYVFETVCIIRCKTMCFEQRYVLISAWTKSKQDSLLFSTFLKHPLKHVSNAL